MSIGKRQSGDDEALELFEAFAEFVEALAEFVEEPAGSWKNSTIQNSTIHLTTKRWTTSRGRSCRSLRP